MIDPPREFNSSIPVGSSVNGNIEEVWGYGGVRQT